MKALVLYGAGQARVEERPEPAAAPEGVVVRPVYGGICGSDLHYYRDGRNGAFAVTEPLVLGHEIVGVVESVGSNVQRIASGDRVAIHPTTPSPLPGDTEGRGINYSTKSVHIGSASTSPHTHGGFTERFLVHQNQIRALPDDLPMQRAALTEPLAVALHAVSLVRERVEGARVLVSGAGPIGNLTVVALLTAGAAHVTVLDFHELPLELAKRVGADETVRIGLDPEPDLESFDVVVEAAGVMPSLESALSYVRRGGVILQLGILPPGPQALPLVDLITREITLQGSQRFHIEIDEAIRVLAATPALNALVTDVFPLDSFARAFDKASDPKSSGKVLLQITDE